MISARVLVLIVALLAGGVTAFAIGGGISRNSEPNSPVVTRPHRDAGRPLAPGKTSQIHSRTREGATAFAVRVAG